jgi:hypothetical protein
LAITIEPEDISSIDIKYREMNEKTDGYAVVHLREHISNVNIFHFMFSMSNKDFLKQVSTLDTAAKKFGYDLNLSQKSRFGLAIEKMMIGALAGTEYQSQGCPACRMIDTFISSERYLMS